MKRSFQPEIAARLIAPLHASLQQCHPRLRRRRRVVELSLVLLSLMQDLQQHRGLSGVLLGREATFRDECEAVGEKLQRSLVEVGQQVGSRYPLLASDSWQSLLVRWDSLRNNWQDLDFQTNLAAHSELVLTLVGILRDLAYAHREDLQTRRYRIIAEWPTQLEHLGLLRALGLHVLTRRQDVLDDAWVGSMLASNLHEVRSVLASTADMEETHAMALATGQAVAMVVSVRTAQTPVVASEYHRVLTSAIDGWYRMIRSRLREAS